MAVSATLETFGLDLSGSWRWTGGIPDGDFVFGIPRNSDQVLVINDRLGSAAFEDYGLDLSGNDKWIGGSPASNGLIYCTPYDAADLLIINPAAGVALRTAMGLSSMGERWKWQGMSRQAADGKLYGVPWNVADFLTIDPSTPSGTLLGGVDIGTASRTAYGAVWTPDTTGEWNGVAIGSNGLVYFSPFNSAYFAILNPLTGDCVLSKLGLTLSRGASLWAGIAPGSDGKLYTCPFGYSYIAVIDPNTPSGVLVGGVDAGTATLETFGATLTGSWSLQDETFGGNIFFAPWGALDVAWLDVASGVVTKSDFGFGSEFGTYSQKIHDGFTRGAVTGKLYGIPFSFPYVLVVDPEEPPPDPILPALPTPRFLADAIDPATGDYRSIIRGVDPIEGAALQALMVQRGSGSAVLEDGQKLRDIKLVDDNLEARLKDEVKYAWRRLIDARQIELSTLTVTAFGDTAILEIAFKNLVSGKPGMIRLPLLQLLPSRGYA